MLQKTIDFIEHLEKTVSRLEQENRQLRDALASGKTDLEISLLVSLNSCMQVYIVVLDDVRTRALQSQFLSSSLFSTATSKPRLPSFNSPPATPLHTLVSPKSTDSGDSGHSSADDIFTVSTRNMCVCV